ncbi:MAG: DUF2298 domain-containing protein [Dehalococcoidia bacterium]|nr:DUF2298 domain-containing protein [Dehalococcoidia bacterium]
MLAVAWWWLLLFTFGLIGFPFPFYLFRYLPDKGYAFGRILTLLFLSYLLWLLALGHVLPNSLPTIIVILLALAVVSFSLFQHRRGEITDFLSREWKTIAITEAIFAGAFFLWTLMRSYSPDLVYGEKLMDFAFLNSVSRSTYFPPHDPWLSGFSISYYYFGYIMMAAVAKLSNTPLVISYTLSTALIFALAAIGVFSLVANLIRLRAPDKPGRAILWGGIGVGLFLLLGNLEGILELLHAHGFGSQGFWQWFGIKDLTGSYESGKWYPTDHVWWWRATRLIDTVKNGQSLDYTIIEFPFFSFIFGDLHPHIMSLPFTLLALTLSLNVFCSREVFNPAWLIHNPLVTLFILVSLGALGFLNTWDFPTFGVILLAALFLKNYYSRRDWREWALVAAIIIVGSIALYLPFYLGLKAQVKGIWPWFGPDTRPQQYFLVWGLFLFIGISFLIARSNNYRKWLKSDIWTMFIATLLVFSPLFLWVFIRTLLVSLVPSFGDLPSASGKLWHLLPLLVILILYLTLLLRRKSQDVWQGGKAASLFSILILFTGLFITMAAELFYLRDLFGNRMNTVFKFYYQAWTLMAIASAFGLYYVLDRWQARVAWSRFLRYLWWSLLLMLVIMASIYPLAASFTFSDGFQRPRTLDGLAYLEKENPGERRAIDFLSRQPRNPVIVEATGDDVNAFGRISARTGLPTILGSVSHEVQWRGSQRLLVERQTDVTAIYRSQNTSEVMGLLKKYGVTFVYVGPLETRTYGERVRDKFKSFLDVAFESDNVRIYQVPGK